MVDDNRDSADVCSMVSVLCNDPSHARLAAKLERFEATLAEQAERIAEQAAKIGELETKLKRNSSNSSRPPSSDSPFEKGKDPRKKRKKKGPKRKPGGQPGHEGHQRDLLDESEVDHIEDHFPAACDDCDHELPQVPDEAPRREQKWDLPPIRPEVTEYRFHSVTCPHCGTRTKAKPGSDIPQGAFGPRLEATVAYLRGSARLSLAEIKRLLADCYGLTISTGALLRISERMSARLEPAYDAALDAVRGSDVVYADETPWYLRHSLAWLWFAGTETLKVYRVDERRTTNALRRFLGEVLRGVLVSDRYTAYRAQPGNRHQFCLAHLDRDAKGLILRGGASKKFGRQLRAIIKIAFREWRRFEDVHGDRGLMCERLSPTWDRLVALLIEGADGNDGRVKGFCSHLIMKAESIWTFTLEECSPTNNLAERGMRKPVLWRRVCLGSQSESGCRFVERILTTVESLRAQGRNILDFLVETAGPMAPGRAPPSLVG